MKLPKPFWLAAAALALALCAGCGSPEPSQQIESIAQTSAPGASSPQADYNGPVISDHRSKKYREHGKIQ